MEHIDHLHSPIHTMPTIHISPAPLAAVKFGRMSKKQREKVEEEVAYHQNENRLRESRANAGHTSPDPWQPSPQVESTTDVGCAPFGIPGWTDNRVQQNPQTWTYPLSNNTHTTFQPPQDSQEFNVDSTTEFTPRSSLTQEPESPADFQSGQLGNSMVYSC
jgi:hypothetical protein